MAKFIFYIGVHTETKLDNGDPHFQEEVTIPANFNNCLEPYEVVHQLKQNLKNKIKERNQK